MAASTVNFTLTTAAYQDVSQGAGFCWFRLRFDRQLKNAVRFHLGTSLPAADTINYELFDPAYNPVGPEEKGEHLWIDVNNLASTDRVYLRADVGSFGVAVHRL